jgi:hypothetical protein
MVVWRASNKKKDEPNGHYYLQRAGTADQITQQNKKVLKEISRPILDFAFF